MPASKGQKPTVEYRFVPGAQEHEIGVKLDGVFVRFASVSDAYAAQRVEHGQNQNNDDDDDEKGSS